MKKKIIIIFVFLSICFSSSTPEFYAFAEEITTVQTIPQKRPADDQFCFDFVEVLPNELVREINTQGAGLKRVYDIDFVMLIIPSLGGRDIIEYTADLFSKWEIGKNTQGKKGILILIAMQEKQIKIEIGYDLEEVYTDLYVGQVEREMLKEFLEQADWERGFLATIENFVERTYRMYKKGMDVKEITAEGKGGYYSEGAGAKTVFDFGAALNKPLPATPQAVRDYFGAQPISQLAFERYMEFCARNMSDYTVDLFSELSKKFFKNWKTASGQRRAEAEHISGRPYAIRQKENHAVVMFPDDDPEELKRSPMYFLLQTDAGWQVDINTMTRGMRCVGPGWWMVTDIFHAYSEIILEEYNLAHGFLTPWNDPSAYSNFFLLADGLYDENEPGLHIGVFYEEKSNLKRGDSILAVNGEKIRDSGHFFSFFKGAPAGSSYSIELIRNGKKMTVTETLMGYPDGFELYRPCLQVPRRWLGVYMVQSLDSEWRHTIQLRDQGMFRYSSLCAILEVYPGSPADKAGLKPDDLILDYGMDDDNGEIMPYDVIKCLNKTRPGESIELTILRDLKHKMKIKVTPEETWHKGYF